MDLGPCQEQNREVETLRGAKADNILQRVLGALQMVSEPNLDRCVSEDAELSWGGGVDCEISHRLVRRTKHSL